MAIWERIGEERKQTVAVDCIREKGTDRCRELQGTMQEVDGRGGEERRVGKLGRRDAAVECLGKNGTNRCRVVLGVTKSWRVGKEAGKRGGKERRQDVAVDCRRQERDRKGVTKSGEGREGGKMWQWTAGGRRGRCETRESAPFPTCHDATPSHSITRTGSGVGAMPPQNPTPSFSLPVI